MKTLFWVLLGASLGVLVYTLLWASPPQIPDVGGGRLNEWYRGRVVWAAFVGGLFGWAWALLSRWSRLQLRHRPGESGREFQSRVARRGMFLLLLTGLIVGPLVVVTSAAFGAGFVPLSRLDRILELLLAVKTLSVVTAAILASGVVYSLTTRFIRWGGQYALLPRVS